MQTMTDAQAARFVAIPDDIDIALLAVRHEFEALAKESADRLAAFKARDAGRVPELSLQIARTPVLKYATPGDDLLT